MPERTRSAELEALTTIAAQVNCTQDLDEILAAALRTTLDVIGADAGEVFLVDEGSGQMRLRVQQGMSPAFQSEEAALRPGECLCGLALESQSTVVAVDLAVHPARTRPACVRDGIRSVVSLPLRARGQVLGLLNIQSRVQRHFTEHDRELLAAIGNQIGIALANARLIDDAEQRRATLDAVMSSLVDGLILLDRRGRLAFVNPCAEEMLGVQGADLGGRPIEVLERAVAGRLLPEAALSMLTDGAAAGGHPAGAELSLSGLVQRTLQARPFPIQYAGGEPLGLGLLLRDVTRERELDEVKSQLLSTVSHELRTPLASIKGFATTLLRQDVEWDEPSRREFLSIIDEESDRLAELIGNLLDMSHVESGRLRVQPEECDLAALVEETAAKFQVMTQAHQLRADLPGDLPQVWADRRRVGQVLSNLVENAIKYSPNGGEIVVSAEAAAGWITVSVFDQGLGLAPDSLEPIFERFYQVDNASTRKVGGSGLGLSICRAIVEAHGGRVWAESELGRGSVFRFTLPLAAAGSPSTGV